MGLTSLESMHEFIEINARNFECYRKGFGEVRGLQLMAFDPREKTNFQYVVVEVDLQEAGINRNELVEILMAENVIARRYFYPGCHRMEPYRSYYPHAGLMLRETEKLADRVLLLPTGTAVGELEIETITHIIRFAIEHAEEISAKLSQRPDLRNVPARHTFQPSS